LIFNIFEFFLIHLGAYLSAAHSDVEKDILGQRRQLSLHGSDYSALKPGDIIGPGDIVGPGDNFSTWMNNRQIRKNGAKNWMSKEELAERKQNAIMYVVSFIKQK
jgi:hypothetical protein